MANKPKIEFKLPSPAIIGWLIIAIMPLVALMYIALLGGLLALAIDAVKLVFRGI